MVKTIGKVSVLDHPHSLAESCHCDLGHMPVCWVTKLGPQSKAGRLSRPWPHQLYVCIFIQLVILLHILCFFHFLFSFFLFFSLLLILSPHLLLFLSFVALLMDLVLNNYDYQLPGGDHYFFLISEIDRYNITSIVSFLVSLTVFLVSYTWGF